MYLLPFKGANRPSSHATPLLPPRLLLSVAIAASEASYQLQKSEVRETVYIEKRLLRSSSASPGCVLVGPVVLRVVFAVLVQCETDESVVTELDARFVETSSSTHWPSWGEHRAGYSHLRPFFSGPFTYRCAIGRTICTQQNMLNNYHEFLRLTSRPSFGRCGGFL